jgi:predicted negative regulator of RcsB-dependent stress response
MTRTGEAARPTVEDHTEDFLEWTKSHSRQLSFAALALLTVGILAYVIAGSRTTKANNANAALNQAEVSLERGDMQGAEASLTQLVRRFKGTSAGTQGVLRLAQVQFEQGKFQEGVSQLEEAAKGNQSGPFAVSLRQMAGAGYEAMGRPADAAARYLEAAEKSQLNGERDLLKAQAARAFRQDGNKTEAIKIWQSIAEKPDSPLINEARLRLGELTAQAAGGR